MSRQEVLNVNTGRPSGTIDAERYAAMRDALLRVVPDDAEGVPSQELAERVLPLLPGPLFEGASVPWYTVTVKLDLEARGLIERIPKRRPQRVRRV